MKAIFDGVICALQTHTDPKDLPEIVAWLAKLLQVDTEEIERLPSYQGGNVIGPVPRLVWPPPTEIARKLRPGGAGVVDMMRDLSYQ